MKLFSLLRKPVMIAALAVVASLGVMTPSAQAIIAPKIPIPLPPQPVPPFGWTYRWVAPIYRTVVDRYWVAERRELVVDWVEVRPGRWEQVYREVIVPGRWETRTRQIAVSQGYWELVRMEPVPYPYPRPIPLPRPIVGVTVGVEGYGQPAITEDLSRFTPLYEWPAR